MTGNQRFLQALELMANQVKSNPRILVVDDEPIIRYLVEGLLSPLYDVTLASSGTEALQKSLENPPPDLILLDWIMPDLDGVSVCRQLQENPLTKGIPVLFLTIKRDISDEVRGFAAGAVDYIPKPVSPPQLMARIKTHLELKAMQKELASERDKLETLLEQRNIELENAQALALGFVESMVLGEQEADRSAFYRLALKENLGINTHQNEVKRFLNSRQNKETQRPVPEVARGVILEQLEKILQSTWFANTERLRDLLKFIVCETLDGHTSTLKAFTIAVEVFQRDENFDPQQDPLIRVHAGNLRKRLEQYYESAGDDDQIVIGVPKGSYHAEFAVRTDLAQHLLTT